jgi:hypothetical protein
MDIKPPITSFIIEAFHLGPKPLETSISTRKCQLTLS